MAALIFHTAISFSWVLFGEPTGLGGLYYSIFLLIVPIVIAMIWRPKRPVREIEEYCVKTKTEMSRSKNDGEHAFSIELKSKEYVKRVAMPNEAGDNVLIEGFLDELEELSIVEDTMLKMKGASGILRTDLKEEEFGKLFSKGGNRSHSKRGSTS